MCILCVLSHTLQSEATVTNNSSDNDQENQSHKQQQQQQRQQSQQLQQSHYQQQQQHQPTTTTAATSARVKPPRLATDSNSIPTAVRKPSVSGSSTSSSIHGTLSRHGSGSSFR
jgi:type II secretory pathway pseudopilin PulG